MESSARHGVLFLLAVAIISAAGATAYVLRPVPTAPKPSPPAGRYQFYFTAVEPRLWVMDTSTGDIFTVNSDNSLRMQVAGEWFDPKNTSMSKAMEAEWHRRHPRPEKSAAEQKRDKQLRDYLKSVGRGENITGPGGMTGDELLWPGSGGTPPWEIVRHGPEVEYRTSPTNGSFEKRKMKTGAEWEPCNEDSDTQAFILTGVERWKQLNAHLAAEGRENETYEEWVWAEDGYGRPPPWEQATPVQAPATK